MKRKNVLIFPAGTEIGYEIFHSLKYCKEINLFGAGQDTLNHAKFIFQNYHNLPSIYEANWIDAIIQLCQNLHIDYIFPAHDDAIVALSRTSNLLPSKVISSPPNACEITRSKSRTYQALNGYIRVPHLYSSIDDVIDYPVFVKPDRGQGSYGIAMANTKSDLINAVNAIDNPIICEYLPGDEFTVDCFSDREAGLLFAGARKRRRVRNGISVNSLTETMPEVRQIADCIGQHLGLHGAWFFQLKRAQDGQLTLLEVAPRIAGSMSVHRVAGINFPLLSIFEAERIPIVINKLNSVIEVDRALSNRYIHSIKFATIYIDLDDTLLNNAKVNLLATKLLFQCINSGKRIVLLTRHRGDLNKTLKLHRLTGIFDEIIHIKDNEKKSTFIADRDSIFVDDSFNERMDVASVCNIPTFDNSMIELLTEQSDFLNY